MSAEDMLVDTTELDATHARILQRARQLRETGVKRDADAPCNRDEYDKADRYFDRHEFTDPDDNLDHYSYGWDQE